MQTPTDTAPAQSDLKSDDARAAKGRAPDPLRQHARWIAIGLVVLLGLAAGIRYWVWSRDHESTDDAFIDCHVVHVAPRVAGQVLRVHVADNQAVEAGALLVEIDPADFRAALDEAVASRDEARGQLSQARAHLLVAEAAQAEADAAILAARADSDFAASDLARYRATRTGSVSKQSVDSATTTAARRAAQLVVKQKARAAADAQIELARAQVEAAEAGVAAGDAAVEQASLNLSYTRIHAADAGLVTQKNVMTGDYLHVGQQIFALVPRRVWVTANFKETQLRGMRPGQSAAIHVDAYDRSFRGRVDSIQAGSGSFFSLLPPENATGNYVKVVQRVPVKIVFEDEIDSVMLGPGMSVEPTVQLE